MPLLPTKPASDEEYIFTRNDPFDRFAPVEMVVPPLIASKPFMNSIREYTVPAGSLAVWYFGQNGFVLKDASGPLIGIDLYLSNSCAALTDGVPIRLDRQLPIFVEPEDLNIDVFVTTHSHQDHADPETIRRVSKNTAMVFVGAV